MWFSYSLLVDNCGALGRAAGRRRRVPRGLRDAATRRPPRAGRRVSAAHTARCGSDRTAQLGARERSVRKPPAQGPRDGAAHGAAGALAAARRRRRLARSHVSRPTLLRGGECSRAILAISI